jgi:hypothetical protein
MKRLLLTIKLLSLFIIFTNVTLHAETIVGEKPAYNKVYRSARIGDSYHFFLLTKKGTFYHLFTNKTDKLTVLELKSSQLLEILNHKQSWGKAFPKKGNYVINNGKVYTKLLWKRIKILSSSKIKYLNKTFSLQ